MISEQHLDKALNVVPNDRLVVRPGETKISELDEAQFSHYIAFNLLGWGYSRGSYWLEFGIEIGTAESFRPLTNKYQGEKLISELGLECTFENLREYIEGLTLDQCKELWRAYDPKQRPYLKKK